MSDEKRTKRVSTEVTSQSIQDELIAIKDRIGAIEIIQSVSNATEVRGYVIEFLKSDHAIKIMNACREQKTKDELQEVGPYNSKQALDRHLQPLKEANLLRREVREDGVVVFDWSYLFRSLPKAMIRSLLEPTKTTGTRK